MSRYDLSHLVQPDTQEVSGPIQDDEALFLYSIITGMRLKRILEIGGMSGYSALNFTKAVGEDGVVYTIDVNEVPCVATNHRILTKDAKDITASDIEGSELDLIFFDCHDADAEMTVYYKLRRAAVITDKTILALHDTNLHPAKTVPWAYEIAGGFVHQAAERMMANQFKMLGYDAFSLHTIASRHNPRFPYRHGVTIMQRFEYMDCEPLDQQSMIKQYLSRLDLTLANLAQQANA